MYCLLLYKCYKYYVLLFLFMLVYFALFPFFLVSFVSMVTSLFCLVLVASLFDFYLLACLFALYGILFSWMIYLSFSRFYGFVCKLCAFHGALFFTLWVVTFCGVVRSFINAKLMIGGGGYFCPKTIWCKSLFLKKFFWKAKNLCCLVVFRCP